MLGHRNKTKQNPMSWEKPARGRCCAPPTELPGGQLWLGDPTGGGGWDGVTASTVTMCNVSGRRLGVRDKASSLEAGRASQSDQTPPGSGNSAGAKCALGTFWNKGNVTGRSCSPAMGWPVLLQPLPRATGKGQPGPAAHCWLDVRQCEFRTLTGPTWGGVAGVSLNQWSYVL